MFGVVYVYLFVPETKGLSLEEVDEMYRARITPWNSTRWRPSQTHAHGNGGGLKAIERDAERDSSEDADGAAEKQEPVEHIEKRE